MDFSCYQNCVLDRILVRLLVYMIAQQNELSIQSCLGLSRCKHNLISIVWFSDSIFVYCFTWAIKKGNLKSLIFRYDLPYLYWPHFLINAQTIWTWPLDTHIDIKYFYLRFKSNDFRPYDILTQSSFWTLILLYVKLIVSFNLIILFLQLAQSSMILQINRKTPVNVSIFNTK